MHYRYNIYFSAPTLFCFMMKKNSNKDLNTFLSFLDEITPLTLKNNLRRILNSKPENLRILRLSRKFNHSYKEVCSHHMNLEREISDDAND